MKMAVPSRKKPSFLTAKRPRGRPSVKARGFQKIGLFSAGRVSKGRRFPPPTRRPPARGVWGSDLPSHPPASHPCKAKIPIARDMGAWGGRQTRAKNLRYPRVSRELALILAKPELARSFYTECARCQRYDFFLGERQFLKTRGAPVKKKRFVLEKSAPDRFCITAPLTGLAA